MIGRKQHAFLRALAAGLLLTAYQACAQHPDAHAVGVFGAYNLNMHTADFRALPGVPSCCPLYETGSGAGLSAGVFYEIPLSEAFSVQIRGGYSENGADLKTTEYTPVDVDGVMTEAAIEHTISSGLSSIGLEPLLGYRFFKALSLHAGLRLALVTGRSYEQVERLVQPGSGTFENDRRIRNELSGDIPEASSVAASLLAGLSYELPLDREGKLKASPELLYSLGLTPVVSSVSWNANSLRAGVALKYRMLPAPETPQSPAAPPPPPPPPTPRKPAPTASIGAVAIENGKETAVGRIVVEEFISTNMRPILQYIFFEDNSSVIPRRYNSISQDEASSFLTDNLHNAGALDVYHHILNIVGQRLRKHETASLTVTGCNSGTGAEKDNRALSRARAESVRDYLTSVWKIETKRIRVEVRDLPRIPSNMSESDGISENRRVELSSNDERILQPLTTKDIERHASPPRIVFMPSVVSEAGVDRWRVRVSHQGKELKVFSGTGAPPARLEWNLTEGMSELPQETASITYGLEAVDPEGRQARSVEGAMPVEQITIRKKRGESAGGDREISRYSLILFDFDKADLNSRNLAVARMVRSELRPASKVRITGHTDRIGDAEYNSRISEQRARNTAAALGARTEDVKGLGENELPFDNDLPEGRFYSRTVNIYVETPVAE